MNGSTNNTIRKHVTTGKIISKYFSSSPVKDDSLSDFQEKKASVKGPKNLQAKVGNIKLKSKKRVKGQKDIRTALKLNNNKLVEYAKEFDNVCKDLGVDVDSEQLQLAIALSKSLHDNEDTGSCKTQSKPICSQKNTAQIRKTLQEYGFTVPDIKIVKKCKKYKRSSKLLLTSEAAKKQIISEKYAQVLFKNVDCSKHSKNYLLDYSDKKLYHISTSITYNEMKNITLFSAINSVEIMDTTGNLLKDWSKIPGRPESPSKCRSLNMNFSEIDCSQDELDIVLSGSLKAAKEIIKDKIPSYNSATSNKSKVEINNDKDASLKSFLKIRSCSPDLFDEEMSNIFDGSINKNKVYSELITSLHEDQHESSNINNFINTSNKSDLVHSDKSSHSTLTQAKGSVIHILYPQVTHSKSNDFMEITDCVDTDIASCPRSFDLSKGYYEHKGKRENHKELTCLNKGNKTRRESNDLMEVTECVNSNECYSSDNINTKIDLTQHNTAAKIDLSQNFDKYDCFIVNENIVNANSSKELQSKLDADLPSVQISEECDKTLILNDEEIQNALHLQSNSVLSQISISKEKGNTGTKSFGSNRISDIYEVKESQKFFDDYIHNHSDVGENSSQECDNFDNIDLTQSSSDGDESSEFIKKDALGKKDDVSIDYDNLYDDNENVSLNSDIAKNSQEEFAHNVLSQSALSNQSSSKYSNQNSGVFEIGEQVLNYSNDRSRDNMCWDDFGGISVVDESFKDVDKCVVAEDKTIFVTPKICSSTSKTQNDSVIIKTDQVTPMLDYNSMSTPERNRELHKYGLKPFKRKRAVQLLTYIYNQTHPIVESCSEYTPSSSKKRKVIPTSPENISEIHKNLAENKENTKAISIYDVTNVIPCIKVIECPEEDWVFQKREKAKVHSCRVPLHIAFHNYVSCRQMLSEAILRYEPVNIDVIHKDLVSQGHRYDPKDLLRFLDKKCITVKTADSNGRNNKRY